MRFVTDVIVSAFLDRKPMTLSNTSTDGRALTLWGNRIAYHLNDDIVISMCGFNSNTTRERLNGLLSKLNQGYISSKKGIPYYKNNQGEFKIDVSKEYSLNTLSEREQEEVQVSLKKKNPGTEKSVDKKPKFVTCWHCGNTEQKILSYDSVFKCDKCKESLWTGEGGYDV